MRFVFHAKILARFQFEWFWLCLSAQYVMSKVQFLWISEGHRPQWSGSIASMKKLSKEWDCFHLQSYPSVVKNSLRNKYFNLGLFRNWLISVFPYVKLGAKWRKNGTLSAVNCLNLFRNALNSLWRNTDMCHRL